MKRVSPFALLVFGAAALLPLGCGGGDDDADANGSASALLPLPEVSNEPVTTEDIMALAYKLYLGDGMELDHPRAARLFHKAAASGDSDAQFALGCMYQNGQGVDQNYMTSAKWYLKSAQAGNANGQYFIGLSFKEGSGVPKDPIESYKWIHLAAEQRVKQEHIDARDQLALLLTPAVLAEGRRRADQYLMYQGIGN